MINQVPLGSSKNDPLQSPVELKVPIRSETTWSLLSERSTETRFQNVGISKLWKRSLNQKLEHVDLRAAHILLTSLGFPAARMSAMLAWNQDFNLTQIRTWMYLTDLDGTMPYVKRNNALKRKGCCLISHRTFQYHALTNQAKTDSCFFPLVILLGGKLVESTSSSLKFGFDALLIFAPLFRTVPLHLWRKWHAKALPLCLKTFGLSPGISVVTSLSPERQEQTPATSEISTLGNYFPHLSTISDHFQLGKEALKGV